LKVGSELHSSATLIPGKEFTVPMDKQMGGPQSQSEHNSEERNLCP